MQQRYFALALLLAGTQLAHAQTTDWRPFRPGFVYTYAAAGNPSPTPSVHTLRVDSAYATAGDSVYTFNRLLRPSTASSWQYRKSRNNLLGARLRWQPGTSSFYLEANAEPAVGAAAATLLLQPRVAMGSSWPASTTPALTATLTSRTRGQVGTATDSLVTITLSNGQQFILSKRNGLVAGPRWLDLSGAGPIWQQAVAPQPGLGAYDPRSLFAMQPGAVLGYSLSRAASIGGLSCAEGNRLRRILTRTQTADSLVLTYQEQDRVTYYQVPAAGCYNTYGTVTKPVKAGRWAFSLRTGRSPQFVMLPLLTLEYRPLPSSTGYDRLWYTASHQFDPSTGNSQLTSYDLVASAGSSGSYQPLTDGQSNYRLATGTGPLSGTEPEFNFLQSFYCPAGSTCPPPTGYAGLLPTRAALAATIASLQPNPAREQTTLTLAAPAPAGTTLALHDALGRQLWQRPVAAGATQLPVLLPGLSAGLYLVQLHLPGQSPLAYRLLAE